MASGFFPVFMTSPTRASSADRVPGAHLRGLSCCYTSLGFTYMTLHSQVTENRGQQPYYSVPNQLISFRTRPTHPLLHPTTQQTGYSEVSETQDSLHSNPSPPFHSSINSNEDHLAYKVSPPAALIPGLVTPQCEHAIASLQ